MSEKLDLLRICSVCKAVDISGNDCWLKEQENPELYREIVDRNSIRDEKRLLKVTHGYCPECFNKEMGKIENERR